MIVIIPARMASTRLPGKVLKDIHGKPVIQRVYEGCLGLNMKVWVATPDDEIKDAVRSFSGNVVHTGEHDTVLSRCAEATEILRPQSVVVVQGDEPMVNPHMIKLAISGLKFDGYGASTLVKKIGSDEDPADPNMVKVIINTEGYIVYASRSVIPGSTPEKHGKFVPSYYKQSCIMAFDAGTLKLWARWPMSDEERAEGIDIVRFVKNAYPLKAVEHIYNTQAVDVQADLERIRELWQK